MFILLSIWRSEAAENRKTGLLKDVFCLEHCVLAAVFIQSSTSCSFGLEKSALLRPVTPKVSLAAVESVLAASSITSSTSRKASVKRGLSFVTGTQER